MKRVWPRHKCVGAAALYFCLGIVSGFVLRRRCAPSHKRTIYRRATTILTELASYGMIGWVKV
jgi:hypothetical protein